ncbi:peptidylprolyl isomerase [Altererythrobacter salegens]|uniref:Peptidylprolyl isomerase n=1 Tax=Croceibacterium salegens TaxID=1737568 RepID=A0A6I4SQG1_9SPHN|nr:peptidylprolyl isomerase [Croceibacterium salegens]MXO58171.1 peptidylprolyl isomerase [Croceibacterium salegens]
MKPSLITASLLALTLASPAAAQETEPPTPASVVAAAPASDWKRIDPADLLVMDLAPDAAGKPRRVVIQLVPAPFSQGWVGNIRKLAQAQWWDGTSVYRVVDNWVAQWGDVDESKALPEGVSEQPDDQYTALWSDVPALYRQAGDIMVNEAERLERVASGAEPNRGDSYAGFTTHSNSWPVAVEAGDVWPTHCYGSVGVARSVGSGGTGSELYAVIGHAPRQLDRNIAVVGRVIEGIEYLSTLPRGPTGTNGVYEDASQRVPILSVRLGSELQEIPQPQFEYLDSDSQSFADYVHVRANRQDPFYLHPAGGIDICNVQPPIRRIPSE